MVIDGGVYNERGIYCRYVVSEKQKKMSKAKVEDEKEGMLWA